MAVIIVVTIIAIIAVTTRTNRLKFLSRWLDFKTVSLEYIADDQKYAQLELAIDKLLKENTDITDIDELILKIPAYIACDSQEEQEYCRTYLKKMFAKGIGKHHE